MINELLISGILFITFHTASAQNHPTVMLSMDDAVKIAITNHPASKNAVLKVEAVKLQKQMAIDPGPMEVGYQYGQINSTLNDRFIEIGQNFGSPFTHIQKRRQARENIKLTEAEQKLVIKQLSADVKKAYTNWVYQYCKWKLLRQEAEEYNSFMMYIGELKAETDSAQSSKADSAEVAERFELNSIETRYAEAQNENFQAEQEYKIATNQLQQWLVADDNVAPGDSTLELYSIKTINIGPDKFSPTNHLTYYQSLKNVSNAQLKVEQSRFFPEIGAGYFNQVINHQKGFQGLSIGMTVPLWFIPQKARVAEARINQKIVENEIEYQKFSLTKSIENLKIKLDQHFVSVSFYRENALENADMQEKITAERFKKREINGASYLDSRNNILQTRLEYLEKLKEYNLTAIQLEYYVN
ncbi:MAG: TolC family protein [Bacteroidota bacterium]|nr:TolC family protein [Bacteroidota bacterium]